MPNLRSISITSNSITVTGSNGAVCLVTRQEIRDEWQGFPGTNAEKRAHVIQWLKDQAEADLGTAQFKPSLFSFGVQGITNWVLNDLDTGSILLEVQGG